jgi:hypothetical protein
MNSQTSVLISTALVVEVQSQAALPVAPTVFALHSPCKMGKPYEHELLKFPDTYAWATARDLGALSTFRESTHQRPGFFIVSGGSLSSAVYAAHLHSIFNGKHEMNPSGA